MVSPGNTAGEQIPILDLTQPAWGALLSPQLEMWSPVPHCTRRPPIATQPVSGRAWVRVPGSHFGTEPFQPHNFLMFNIRKKRPPSWKSFTRHGESRELRTHPGKELHLRRGGVETPDPQEEITPGAALRGWGGVGLRPSTGSLSFGVLSLRAGKARDVLPGVGHRARGYLGGMWRVAGWRWEMRWVRAKGGRVGPSAGMWLSRAWDPQKPPTPDSPFTPISSSSDALESLLRTGQ